MKSVPGALIRIGDRPLAHPGPEGARPDIADVPAASKLAATGLNGWMDADAQN
jgi:hypothetical protein